MKILIVDTYYPAFLRSFWHRHPELRGAPYAKQRRALLAQCFGTADYYSRNLRAVGQTAQDLVVNDAISQRTWAREHQVPVRTAGVYAWLQSLPLLHRIIGRPAWVQEVVLAQIQTIKPDVLYVHDLSILNPETIRAARQWVTLVVGQTASPLPAERNVKAFDLILTSFPHFVPRLRALGVNAEFLKIAFEPRVLERVGEEERIYDVSFIGSFSPHHQAGTKLLEAVAAKHPIHIWGHGVRYLAPNSPLRRQYHGEAWGLDMYRVLGQSRIVLNRHISTAEHYANNMRLYETTGMGAMLLTDTKKNLSELFRVGKEVVAYRSVTDLATKLRYYLDHERERSNIAQAGQRRTLREHTYAARMRELVPILEQYL
ncbi:glycosyltransferase [Candidatus Berkelbacteria bacterium]|nr:glycosyltransferase [Candidatus Berkelbacteria bacterium]